MAGINRLGKAPPKPGTLRPPDPNKYRTVDMFSEGAEADMDYLKTVRDIEEMQQQQGWLFGRGAFDKADLLYLRDTAEQQRHMELELRDSERNQFAALRAKLEHQHQDAGTSSSRPKRERDHTSETSVSKPPPKLAPSILPKQRLSAKQDKRNYEQGTEPPDKRSKNDVHDEVAPSTRGSSQAAGSSIQESKLVHPAANPASNNEDSDDAGLLGLLGGYGSDSGQEDSDASDSISEDSKDSNDSSDQERGGSFTAPGDEIEKSASGLPSAAALLGD